jgi:hypothetical protein
MQWKRVNRNQERSSASIGEKKSRSAYYSTHAIQLKCIPPPQLALSVLSSASVHPLLRVWAYSSVPVEAGQHLLPLVVLLVDFQLLAWAWTWA